MTPDKVYDFYYSHKCNEHGTTKRFFKNIPFNHAIEHGKSTDHIKWDDLMKVGTGTYKDVTINGFCIFNNKGDIKWNQN